MSLLKKFHRDGKKVVVELEQDVEPIIERNKKLKNEPQSRKSNFRHIGSIPNIFINKWLNEEWERGNAHIKMFDEEFNKLVGRKLRDPDYAFLRTDK
jgi:uncharacterized FAD-dependent dehydrogenase